MNLWEEASKWEKQWHGNCVNSYMEEEKQLIYVNRMGIKTYHDGKTPYNFDLKGNILDMGGGPYSILLKCPNKLSGTVIDPCNYPDWIRQRYESAGIELVKMKAEEFKSNTVFDLGLCYNVLQHVENPELVIRNMRKTCKEIRIFEWCLNGISPGHLHNLIPEELDKWLNGEGKVEKLNTPICKGLCYYGIFPGDIK